MLSFCTRLTLMIFLPEIIYPNQPSLICSYAWGFGFSPVQSDGSLSSHLVLFSQITLIPYTFCPSYLQSLLSSVVSSSHVRCYRVCAFSGTGGHVNVLCSPEQSSPSHSYLIQELSTLVPEVCLCFPTPLRNVTTHPRYVCVFVYVVLFCAGVICLFIMLSFSLLFSVHFYFVEHHILCLWSFIALSLADEFFVCSVITTGGQ